MSGSNANEILCDVTALPAPLPLETILLKLDQLPVEHYLRVTHRFRPKLLFPILQERGLSYLVKEFQTDGVIEIFIWHQQNIELGNKLKGG
jgi:hypothetical protein